MSDSAIAQMIREVLAEELGKIRAGSGDQGAAQGPAVREEWVSISSDADLKGLVKKILALADNARERQAIERGEIVFRLAGAAQSGASASGQAPAAGGGAAEIASGIISERQVDRLPSGTTQVRIGKAVRLTPLAKDRLRQRGIAIERMER